MRRLTQLCVGAEGPVLGYRACAGHVGRAPQGKLMSTARPRRKVRACPLGIATSVGAMNIWPLANQLTAALSDCRVHASQ
jgi:hypothetical protein